ncbi:hypothetical protein [Ulvibacterium sp.]|uniref:hypothetical protein n=1 Tax=Ulvibacterium sp. TaxID=2665914 RepID=UPI002625FA76|nr:hypothetical protein [Ulvibacterium sp.]
MKKNTSERIDELIDSAPDIETVNTPPFFKDKVLQRLSQPRDSQPQLGWLPWFTPKYQMAALFLFVLLNALVLYTYSDSNREEEIQTFAEAYGLSSAQEETLLN